MTQQPAHPLTARLACGDTDPANTPTPAIEFSSATIAQPVIDPPHVGDLPPTDAEVASVITAMHDAISYLEGRVAFAKWAATCEGDPRFGTGLELVDGGASHG